MALPPRSRPRPKTPAMNSAPAGPMPAKPAAPTTPRVRRDSVRRPMMGIPAALKAPKPSRPNAFQPTPTMTFSPANRTPKPAPAPMTPLQTRPIQDKAPFLNPTSIRRGGSR